jgi:hypothetical protein
MTGEKEGRAKEKVKHQKSIFIYFLTVTLWVHQSLMGETPKTALVHLSPIPY